MAKNQKLLNHEYPKVSPSVRGIKFRKHSGGTRSLPRRRIGVSHLIPCLKRKGSGGRGVY